MYVDDAEENIEGGIVHVLLAITRGVLGISRYRYDQRRNGERRAKNKVYRPFSNRWVFMRYGTAADVYGGSQPE
jgi:hypothetical protein